MEQAYLDLVDNCIRNGDRKSDRTKVGTLSLFGAQLEFDLEGSIVPLLTTKKIEYKSVLKELLWIMKGQTDAKQSGVGLWDSNGSRDFLDSLGFQNRAEGDLGPIYGFQWRHAGAAYIDSRTDYTDMGIDQLQRLVNTLNSNPADRRMIIDSWNVSQLDQMALPPCHCFVQFYVRRQRFLDCKLYQRSADLGLGVPFNIASYSFLMYVISKWCNLVPGKFIHTFGDVHVYSNHVQPLKEQLTRQIYPFPSVEFNGHFALDDLKDVKTEDWCDSFVVKNYHHHPPIKLKMAL